MNFILSEMTFLRYYMPLIIEAKNRGIRSRVFVGRNNKYNNPRAFVDYIGDLSRVHKFEILDLDEAHKYAGIVFLVEGVEHNKVDNSKTRIVSLTYMTDYSGLYDSYVNKVDHIVLPSKSFAKAYNKNSPKNLYLGSPKYDVELNEEEILRKYDLSGSKKALVIAPRSRDLGNAKLAQIYKTLNSHGLEVLVKTRGKDPLARSLHGDKYFTDPSWYPHTTMELIHISDIVVNFSSTAIKECVMLRTPLINFHIKPFEKPLKFLYEYDYCENFGKEFDENQLQNAINRLTNQDLGDIFNISIEKHLFTGSSSKRILDYLELY